MTNGTGTGGGGGPIICDPGGPTDDVDMDGYTPDDGDCEDCDPSRNPNAIEVPTDPGKTPYDENCDMTIDEPLPDPCDAGLEIDDEEIGDAPHDGVPGGDVGARAGENFLAADADPFLAVFEVIEEGAAGLGELGGDFFQRRAGAPQPRLHPRVGRRRRQRHLLHGVKGAVAQVARQPHGAEHADLLAQLRA